MKTTLLALSLILSVAAMAQNKPMCKGITKKGTNCANHTAVGSDYCHLHSPNAIRCGAPTKSGGECKMVVKHAGDKCWRHKIK